MCFERRQLYICTKALQMHGLQKLLWFKWLRFLFQFNSSFRADCINPFILACLVWFLSLSMKYYEEKKNDENNRRWLLLEQNTTLFTFRLLTITVLHVIFCFTFQGTGRQHCGRVFLFSLRLQWGDVLQKRSCRTLVDWICSKDLLGQPLTFVASCTIKANDLAI